MGYAYHPGLKSDAERAVKRASGVDTVVNRIEELTPSPNDDDLRWKLYYAVYREPFLSRYAPGGGLLWATGTPSVVASIRWMSRIFQVWSRRETSPFISWSRTAASGSSAWSITRGQDHRRDEGETGNWFL
jgi:hypothetical protein